MLPITFPGLLLLATILLCLSLLYHIIWNAFFSPLSRYPGPFLSKFNRIPFTIENLRLESHTALLRWHKKYGPVIRVAPTELSCTTPEVWRHVWAHRQGHEEFMKTPFQVAPSGLRNVLSAYRSDHARFRRLLSHVFRTQGLDSQEPHIQHFVDPYESQLTKKAAETPKQNIVDSHNWTTFDLRGDLGCLDTCSTRCWITDLTGNLEHGVWNSQLLKHGLSSLVKLIAPKNLQKSRMNNYRYASEKIEARVSFGKANNSKNDF